MAHWAEIDENNIVTQVTVGSNDDPDEGYQWLVDNLGGTWVKTSYNTRLGIHVKLNEDTSEGADTWIPSGKPQLRKNFACIGMIYDSVRDAFYWPQPYPSWILDEEKCIWEAPVPAPTPVEGKEYRWDEPTLSWVETTPA